MVKILQLFLATVFLIIIEIYCSKLIGNILSEYYESEVVKKFKGEWVKYKKPFENAIMTNIKENYGMKSMNIYMRHARDTFRFTRGFSLSDNVVHVLFSDMILRDWPNLIMPEVSLSLPGNLLKVEATVGKMFVDTVYRMMRNESAVLYSEAELEKAKHSPFSLQQVQSTGNLTIVAEDCFLSGFSIVSFLGNSVTLGHSTYRLVDCKFTVEISSDVGTPPVIAPYFPKGPGKQIESLLSAPLRDEMVQNLQGAMYSYINTSVIFGKGLPNYKINQQILFKKTSSYLTLLCDKLNKLTLEGQKGSIALSDFEDHMETKTDEKRSTTYLSLKELKLYGLDTAYATRTGGSFEAAQLSIADSIRFHSLQVRGKAFYDNGTQCTHNFAVELADLAVNIIINIEKQGSNSVHKFEVVFGRTFGFSVLPWETGINERIWYQALVSGYIINEVPARITEHLSAVLTPAANADEQENLKYEENSWETMKKEKIPKKNDTSTDVTNEEPSEESVKESSVQNEDENGSDSSTDKDSSTSAEQLQNLPNKTQEDDVGVMVTAPEAVLESDDSASDKPVRSTDTVTAPDSDFQLSNDDKKLFSGLESLADGKQDAFLDPNFFSDDKGKRPFFSDIEAKQTDKENLAGDKTDAVLEKDFFSDHKGKKPFFSDISAEQPDKESLAGDKTDAVLEKDFFSDHKGKKPFFSDISAEQPDKESLAGDKTDAVLEKDFFSDHKGQKPFFSDIEAEQTDKENLAGDKTDAVLDKNFFSNDEVKKPFFSDDDGDKKFISDGDGDKFSVKSEDDGEEHSVKSVDNVNKNSDMINKKEILIFASSENDGDKLKTEMTNNENDEDQLNDATAEQSDQQSVPIERNGKNSHGIAENKTINRRRPTKKMHKRNKKELNNLKMTLKRNPRANTTEVNIQKIITQSVKHVQESKHDNKTRLLQNEVHMSDNEIR